jgi:hypothetical protein
VREGPAAGARPLISARRGRRGPRHHSRAAVGHDTRTPAVVGHDTRNLAAVGHGARNLAAVPYDGRNLALPASTADRWRFLTILIRPFIFRKS